MAAFIFKVVAWWAFLNRNGLVVRHPKSTPADRTIMPVLIFACQFKSRIVNLCELLVHRELRGISHLRHSRYRSFSLAITICISQQDV